jgi:GT2 family glycosyltransferase
MGKDSDPFGSRQALLVLGMHRAGTSALARVLALRGANLPAHVLPPNRGNVDGYWEPQGVVELNDRILDACDTAWDDPFASGRLSDGRSLVAAFREEAVAVLGREYGAAGLIVLKDPRCTLLREFWSEALAARGFQARPVAIMRPCADVVASLVRRDATSAESAAWLYVAYGLETARAIAAGASSLTYGQLVGDWRGSTDRIAAEQGVAWPAAARDSEGRVAAYLKPSSAAAPGPPLPRSLQDWSERVWAWCRDAAEGKPRPLVELQDVVDGLRAAADGFAPVLRDRSHRQRLVEAERDDALRERDSSLRVYQETDLRLRDAQAAFSQLEGRSESEKDAMRRGYEARLAGVEAEKADMRSRYEARLAESEAEKADMRSRYEARLAESEAEKADMGRAYGILADEKDQVLQTYRRTDELLRQTQLDYQQRDRDYHATRAALEASFAEAGALRRELEAIHASHSWRLTAPLRALVRRARGEVPWWPPRPAAADVPSLAPSLIRPAEAASRVEAEAPASNMETAAPLARPHPQLRAFLVEDFGEAAAADTVLRIDRYRLPIVGDEVRGASQIECGEEQAVAWAREIARRAPAEVDAPDVSIIVPVYNQVPFTLACIDALLAHESRHSFEILVGDDASTDATAAALADPIRRVRHIRHPANLGFVRNCNATAAQARGRYVLFLNNDTQVLPRWLDELVGTLEADPAIGLAGSKLIYPDGRLQECGAIVWRDGSAWNVGRLADPRRPEFSYLRDVDYVSGASIALRRDVWESLGGFDEAFVPAYAEDADLAFRVRDRGLRTVVQPLSQLLHFEGVSSGTDLGCGAKAYQVENLRKLHARWAHVLSGHRDNADSPELEKERGVAKRVLFVDHCTPTPNEDAGSLVAFEVMQAFRAHGYKVTFVPEDNFAHMGADTRDLQRIGIETIYHPAYSRMPAFLDARQDPFDVIFLHRFGVGEAHMQALRRKFPRARIMFLNADMHHLRESREAELSGDARAAAKAAETRRRELGVVAGADVTLVHSDFELALLRRELPGARITLFPLIHDPVAEVAPLAGRDGVCFVGGFRHPPNADGIRWFVDAAWPLVLREIPDAKLYIVGSHMPPDVEALGERPGVEATGFVADLPAFLDRRRASVAPLRYGAGAKGKVAASLAQGLPAVCTPVAAEGMGLEPGTNVLVGDAPDALAAHLVCLLRDDARWHALSDAGLEFAREVTSRARAHARIDALLARWN